MQPVLNVGGNWNNGSNDGLWYWNGNNDASNYNSNIGGRILIENILCSTHNPCPLAKNTS